MAMRMIASAAVVDPADMMVVAGLRRAGIVLVADDLGAVLAELAVHRRLVFAQFLDPLAKGVEHRRMVAQIRRVDEFDFGNEARCRVTLGIDAFDQDAGEQEIRKPSYSIRASVAGPRREPSATIRTVCR